MNLRKYWHFKDHRNMLDYMYLHPFIVMILADMSWYCAKYNLPFVITSAISTKVEDEALKRVSRTHREGRAVDLRSRGWSATEREQFEKYFNDKYKQEYGAISSYTERPKLIHYHDSGHGSHFHIQTRFK